MTRALITLLLSSLILSSCGTVRDSRLNPFNWFGSARSQAVDAQNTNPLIPARRASVFRAKQDEAYQGKLVGEVSTMQIERRPGGALLTVTGIADFQGLYELKLVKNKEDSDASTLSYDLRAYQPRGAAGSEHSRTASAALWLTDNDLAEIRSIRVRGDRNIQTVNR